MKNHDEGAAWVARAQAAHGFQANAILGRPLASPEWIAEAERAMMRKLGPAKRGPRPRERAGDGNLV